MASTTFDAHRSPAAPDPFPAGRRPLRWTGMHAGVAAVHVGAAAAVVASPATWPWALGAVAASHAFTVVQTFFPQAQLLGPALTRLPRAFADRGAVALTFDDGPDPEVTPATLDLLDAAGAKATFFCVGEEVRRFPALAREIVARGHAVENHSYSHSIYIGLWSPSRLRRDLAAAQDAIADATGVVPRFFRPPFGVRNPMTEPALAGIGLHCVVWCARAYDTVELDPARVVRRLTRTLDAGAIALLHDGIAIRGHRGPSAMLAALPQILATLSARKLHSIQLRALLPA